MDAMKKYNLLFLVSGGALCVLFAAVFFLSPRFDYGKVVAIKPLGLLVFVEVLLGVFYLFSLWALYRAEKSRNLIIFSIAFGLTFRVLLFFSMPVLEDDFYRYFWDGGALAHGLNPYAYSPRDVLDAEKAVGKSGAHSGASSLMPLASESSVVLKRINYPGVRTVYPVVAESAFAVSYATSPNNLFVWRLILLLFDIAALLLLMALLKELRLPLFLFVIYWWNPLLVREIYNAAHLDVLAFPFMLGAALFTLRKKPARAAIFLSLAVGVKIWPVVIFPVLLHGFWNEKKHAMRFTFSFCVTSFLLFIPVLLSGMDLTSGFTAYASKWEMNDALFLVFVRVSQFFVEQIGFHILNAQSLARLLSIFTLGIVFVLLAKDGVPSREKLLTRCLIMVAALFMLSPAQFPWYATWFIPFLVFSPRPWLLLLTVLLPLYHLRFYFNAQDNAAFFDNVLVWVEYVPVWALMFLEMSGACNARFVLKPVAEGAS